VNDKTVQAFAEGIVIDDGVDERFQALPAKLIILTPHSANGVDGFMDGIGNATENATEDMMAQVQEVLVTIHEGRFHQVKRMFAAAGAQVVFLKRLSMGPISLDEKLSPGEYRMLTQEEIQVLYAHKGMGS
jgi:16S rRNA pseudouridine516 synthase